MVVLVKYFALLRDAAGRSDESWNVSSGITAGDLFGKVTDRYGINLKPVDALVAINDAYASMDRALSDGDVIVFMPPLAGG